MQQVDVRVFQEREIRFPEHRDEIVFVRRRFARALNHLEERQRFLLLEALRECQLAHPILVEQPRETVGVFDVPAASRHTGTSHHKNSPSAMTSVSSSASFQIAPKPARSESIAPR
jgi:hypothetical protein